MNHCVRDNQFFGFFGWARFTEAGYFGVEKTGSRNGECIM